MQIRSFINDFSSQKKRLFRITLLYYHVSHLPIVRSSTIQVCQQTKAKLPDGIPLKKYILRYYVHWRRFLGDELTGIQLFQCTIFRLCDPMLKFSPKLMLKSTEEILNAMETITPTKFIVDVTMADLTRLGHGGAHRKETSLSYQPLLESNKNPFKK